MISLSSIRTQGCEDEGCSVLFLGKGPDDESGVVFGKCGARCLAADGHWPGSPENHSGSRHRPGGPQGQDGDDNLDLAQDGQ